MSKKTLNYSEQNLSLIQPLSSEFLSYQSYHHLDPFKDNNFKSEFADPDMDGEKQYEIFLRGIIHDVNNNLMGVISACDQLEYNGNEIDPKDVTSSIRAHAKSITSLMRDLLDNQNMETPVKMKETELKSFLKGVLPSLSLVAGQDTRIELGDFNVPAVMVHPMLLHRVLLQLVRNVSELQIEHPLAFITARRHHEWCEISVSDNGPGIDGISSDEVFESGFTTKGQHGTRGYGLAAVAWAVKTWNGKYGVDDIAGDSGCRFWVRLPLATT